jgi:AbrB family looped-hinge helix DNA binding protein
MKTTLDRFGRVLIPKKLREGLGLEQGDALELQLEDGKLTLLPRRSPPTLRLKGRVLVVESEATGDLYQVLNHLREERLDELSR